MPLPFGLADVLDLLVVWGLIWLAISWLHGSRARLALIGLGALLATYLVARQLGMTVTTLILQGFVTVSVLIGVIVFQEDLRSLFERIAALGLRQRTPATGQDLVDRLVRTLAQLVRDRHGALIVLPGRQPLERITEGGIPLDARLSEPLLLSLFDPHSPGHDGALILQGDRAERFAVHLPLSSDHDQLASRGTRHAAALGLAERSDALCVVVSEERGEVSIARDGVLQTLAAPGEAAPLIRAFLTESGSAAAQEGASVRWRQPALAGAIALTLWLLAVPGSSPVEAARDVAVEVRGLPAGYRIESVEPPQVRVTLEGHRRDLYLIEDGALRVAIDVILVDLGRRTFPVGIENVEYPPGVTPVSVEPDRVKISVQQAPAASR